MPQHALYEYKKLVEGQFVEWSTRGQCRGTTNKLFYSERTEEQRAIAAEFCTTCPVQFECLEYAVVMDERAGVWGGMGERDRDRMVRLMRQEYPQWHAQHNVRPLLKVILASFTGIRPRKRVHQAVDTG